MIKYYLTLPEGLGTYEIPQSQYLEIYHQMESKDSESFDTIIRTDCLVTESKTFSGYKMIKKDIAVKGKPCQRHERLLVGVSFIDDHK